MSAIKLYYACRNIKNFGDMLSLDIGKHIFQKEFEFAEPFHCEAAFIGSILEQFLYPYKGFIHKTYLGNWKKPVQIWGAGFRAETNEIVKRPQNLEEQFYRKLDIHAVRGRKTRDRLEKILNRDLSAVPMGDPGLLASLLVNQNEIKKQYKVGLIPHYVDKDADMSNICLPDSTIIDVCQDPITCISKIAECEVILSSSLHGMIIADSLGIPNVRLVFSDKIAGGDYKYDDYYSAFGITSHRKIQMNEEKITSDDLNSIISEYSITKDMISEKQKALINAFPYK